jgi:hypothetical protein
LDSPPQISGQDFPAGLIETFQKRCRHPEGLNGLIPKTHDGTGQTGQLSLSREWYGIGKPENTGRHAGIRHDGLGDAILMGLLEGLGAFEKTDGAPENRKVIPLQSA